MSPASLEELARRHRLELVVQFGSTVSGRTHQHSDVDLGVLFERSSDSSGDYLELVGELQALYPQRDVDVAILNHVDPLFLKKVTEQCRLLYGSPARLQRLKLYAFKRYQDHRRFLAMERDYIRRKSASAR